MLIKSALIVDDSKSARLVLQRLLARIQVNVDTVESAEAALAFLEHRQPDIIFMDHMMPGMDGLELLNHVKQQHPWLPVLLMTAYGDVSQAVQAMQKGADDYLMKPFELRELEALLKPYTQGEAQVSDKDQPVCESFASQQLFSPST